MPDFEGKKLNSEGDGDSVDEGADERAMLCPTVAFTEDDEGSG